MANLQNLVKGDEIHKFTPEEHSRGGKASAKVRREKATMKHTLEMLLDERSTNGKTYRELATLGLIKGAVNGNSQNYRTILEVIGEINRAEEEKSAKELSRVEELLAKISEEAQK